VTEPTWTAPLEAAATAYAAIVATAAFALEVRRWLKERPKLDISLMPDAVMVTSGGSDEDESDESDERFLLVNVVNRGGSSTTIPSAHRLSNALAKCLTGEASVAPVARVARMLQLEPVLDRLPSHISEGEKQRVAVARAVVRDPNCFLFDEPLSRLDVELRQTMRGQIKSVLTGLSKATVIVTHDQLEALTMADRIAIMRDGAIEQIASPHEVFARPTTLFVASFIGTPQMNLLTAQFDGVEGARPVHSGRPADPPCCGSGGEETRKGTGDHRYLAPRAHSGRRGRRRHDLRARGTDRANGR